MGYHLAGFDVVGVDINEQKRYPFEFHKADAMTYSLEGFDVIHASPPCQKWSVASAGHRKDGKEYIDCLTPTRERLEEAGIPYVIENVHGAPLKNYVIMLCGLMFDLKVFRHRYFECSLLVPQLEHPAHKGKRIGEGYYSVAGSAGRWRLWGKSKEGISKGSIAEIRDAMGIDWMVRRELNQAIPPAYTKWIGKQLIRMGV